MDFFQYWPHLSTLASVCEVSLCISFSALVSSASRNKTETEKKISSLSSSSGMVLLSINIKKSSEFSTEWRLDTVEDGASLKQKKTPQRMPVRACG